MGWGGEGIHSVWELASISRRRHECRRSPHAAAMSGGGSSSSNARIWRAVRCGAVGACLSPPCMTHAPHACCANSFGPTRSFFEQVAQKCEACRSSFCTCGQANWRAPPRSPVNGRDGAALTRTRATQSVTRTRATHAEDRMGRIQGLA